MVEGLLKLIYESFKEIQFWVYYRPLFLKILKRKNEFYTSLPKEYRNKFLRTVQDHYEYFEFISRKNFRITRSIKTIVSSGAAQLALHLPSECLTFYTRIIIYPEDYYSRITKLKHKGEINPGFRLIVFSWKSILESLEKKKEDRNLLLHEFAHALWLEHKLMNHVYEIFNDEFIKNFETEARHEMSLVGSNESHFFRRYAFQNIEEFFAVAVENFFERSVAFQNTLPGIYNILVKLFHQNPANSKVNVSKESPS